MLPAIAAVDVDRRADLHVDVVAHLEVCQRVRAVLAAQQHLAAFGDLRVAGFVHQARCVDDFPIDDGHAGDIVSERVRSAYGPVERVVAPCSGVDTDRVCGELRVVQPAQLVLVAVRGERAGGGEHLHGRLLPGDREAGHGGLRADAQLRLGDGGVDRRISVVDVEEGAVHGGDGLAALCRRRP